MFPIVRRVVLVSAAGLAPPRYSPKAHPFFWVEEGVEKLPRVMRFSWQPQTGDVHLGVQCSHRLLVPRNGPHPYESYLRGFVLPGVPALALVRYYWPQDENDHWDRHHEKLDLRVSRSFLMLIRPALPAGMLTFASYENSFLRARYGDELKDQ